MDDKIGAPAPQQTTQKPDDPLQGLRLARGQDGKGYALLGHHWVRIDSVAMRRAARQSR